MYFCLYPSVVNITADAKSGHTEREEKHSLLFLRLRCSSYVFCTMWRSCIWLLEAENLLIVGRFARRTAGEDTLLCSIVSRDGIL